ncbi:conserved hypothetical protein [Ixodes scapularis]|uniref:RWD domain-containing protein n=1 Tax=Ixodes scapularis TaxID=6945 RepID=B7PAE7_IXOSC|nr:conserved hypothetical protein [Ixodes scapularis]|eukprot:XP_002406815.1 conserved hypothetical protein [Ixodes scapularis]
MRFLAFEAGASQVKWNKITQHVLATSHDGDVRIWDTRKSASPVQYIAAHSSKIYGLGWNPASENQLATSSQDGTVKVTYCCFYNICLTNVLFHSSYAAQQFYVQYSRVKIIEVVLKYFCTTCPFGNGLVTVLVPRQRKGDNNLVIWNCFHLNEPVQAFHGHSDAILEFGWRKPRLDSRDYQLVTWSKDQSLHLWNVDVRLQGVIYILYYNFFSELNSSSFSFSFLFPGTDEQQCGQEVSEEDSVSLGASMLAEVPSTPVSSELSKSFGPLPGDSPLPQHPPFDLEREFSLLNINIPKVIVQELDPGKRVCCVTVTVGMHILGLKLTFPQLYPYNASPTFQFLKGTTVDSNVKAKLLRVLRMTSEQHVKRNRSCLEPCLRQLVATLESCIVKVEDNDSGYISERLKLPYAVYGSFQDSSVPFPRTSGARFCGADYLVCFTRPSHFQKMNAPTEVTPRSLSALGAYLASQHKASRPPSTSSLVSLYAPHSRTQRRTGRQASSQQHPVPSAAVLLYNMSGIMPINQVLAQNYLLDCGDPVGSCNHNASWAASVGRKDLVQVWSLAALVANPDLAHDKQSPDVGVPWAQHPFGRQMLESIISHYLRHSDIQTVAMLCCLFGGGNVDGNSGKKFAFDQACTSVSSVIGIAFFCSATSLESLKRNRSNSWSDSIDDIRYMDNSPDPQKVERAKHRANCNTQYDEFKKKYAEILYKWNLFEQRASVLKCLSTSPPKHKGVEFITTCHYCKHDVKNVQCTQCKRLSLLCVVCHIAVRGHAHACVACGHGGHVEHMLSWFKEQSQCPSGCGCHCLDEGKVFA